MTADLALDLDRCARLRVDLDAAGVGVLDIEVLRLGPDLDDSAVARAVEAATVLGARHLLVVNPALEQSEAVDRLGRIVDLARGSGVRPCLEPMRFTRCRTLGDAVATAVPCGAGVLVDALHLFRAGDDEHALADAVRTHGPELFPYAQVCDAGPDEPVGDAALREEAVAGRLLPGEGVLPLDDLLRQLPTGLALSVESPTRALAGRPAADRAAAMMRAVRGLVQPTHRRGSGLRG